MKKSIALLMAVVMTLSLAACGGATAPEETVPVETETALVETVAQQTPQETVPEEVTVITGAENCISTLAALGYREANPELLAKKTEEFSGVAGASATPVSMELSGSDFRMDLETVEYFYEARELRRTNGWKLYGTRGDSLQVFVDAESQGYERFDEMPLSEEADPGFCEMADYTYYRLNEEDRAEAMLYITAAFYPQTGNLYNVVQEFFEAPEEYATALILASTPKEFSSIDTVEIIQWGEFTVELHPFILQYGNKSYVYQYRPGMSFSDWACSELNTDGWIHWYDDTVLSPDRKYIAGTGYLAMEKFNEDVLTIVAQEFDGKLDHTYMSQVEVVGGIENYDQMMDYLQSEQVEIKNYGNINVPVAHMVNARTPLCTPGFRTVGRKEGRAAYHSVEFGQSMFLLDDIIDIYMNEIDEALIPHIKLYAFPESDVFLKTLEGQLILNAHPSPLEKDSDMLSIPEDAVCLTFRRVSDGQEAPNSPNPLRPGHENLNRNAVFARYVTKEDPNFGEGVNMVFAITFDDELVYWLHMGANFYESVEVQQIIPAMGY